MKITYFDKKQTKGKYIYENGNVYVGGFKNGKFHGEGILIYKDKGEYRGEWKDGKLVKGNYYFKDGLKYDDNWKYLMENSFYYNEEINKNEIIYSEPKTNIYFDHVYDTGDGFYKGDKSVYDFNKKEEIRKICEREKTWVENHCAIY